MAILGFGTVASVGFLFIAMIKTLGSRYRLLIMIKIFFLFQTALTYFDLNDENHNETETNEDGEAWKQKDNQNQKKLVSSTIKKSMLILFVSMIFLTISYLTYFGMFVFLKNRITIVQNVTVSGDGPIRKVLKKIPN